MFKIADLHVDTLCPLTDRGLSFDNTQTMLNLSTMKKGNVQFQIFACFTLPDKPYERVNQLIDTYDLMLRDNKKFVPTLTKDDFAKDGIHTMISIEEGMALEGKMERLIEFYNRGVRLITLTWNYPNEIGFPNNPKENIPNVTDGLTEFGRQLVEKMNELGVAIDISHLGDKCALEVLNMSKKPVIASHSGARAVCNHVRNLTDEMILLLIKNGGFMGINFCKDFLTKRDEATIDDIIKHINHVRDLGGIDNVGFGSDYDGISNKNIEMKDASFFQEIANRLLAEGYSRGEVEKICYLNAINVFKRILK